MFFKLLEKITYIYRRFVTVVIYKPFFNSLGSKTIIYTPLKIVNTKRIDIGSNVTIEKYSTLYSVGEYNKKIYNGKIKIGNNVYINNNCNITSSNNINIKDNVVIAFNVSFFDFNHDYTNITIPVKFSKLDVLGEIIISENCWIGMNVSIVGNVHLGMHCIVGANSVVTKSFPAYSVIVGNPARVIKRYDIEKQIWRKTNKEGAFLNEI